MENAKNAGNVNANGENNLKNAYFSCKIKLNHVK